LAAVVRNEILPIRRGLNFILGSITDPWEGIHTESSAVVQQNEVSFLAPVSTFYGINSKKYCMVLGEVTHSHIICSHIWPKHTAGRGLDMFGLEESDVSNPRNFLRLHTAIERAFDRKQLTFVADPSVDGVISLKLVVLDPNLMQGSFFASEAEIFFSALHDNPIHYQFQPNRRPFLRLLATHTKQAFEKAKANGWIEQDAQSEGRQRALELARLSIGPTDNSSVLSLFFNT
jgi:hypothetical protein